MLSFKDYLAVRSTGETELQDLNAKKRHRAIGMWEDAAMKKEDGAGDPVDPNTGTKRMIEKSEVPPPKSPTSTVAGAESRWAKKKAAATGSSTKCTSSKPRAAKAA